MADEGVPGYKLHDVVKGHHTHERMHVVGRTG